MDGPDFDDLIRALAGSRRVLLSGGAVVAIWLGITSVDSRKKRTPKPEPT